jgi:hypothetical protein
MLLQHLIPRLEERFPQQFSVTKAGAIFPAKHSEVGGVEIVDDGDEITVCVGNFTHVHFANYDSSKGLDQAAKRVADDVVAFLIRLFSDHVVLWGSLSGRGGTYERGTKPSIFSFKRGQEYVWSGPIDGRDK